MSRKRNDKVPEKIYIPDDDYDDEVTDFSFEGYEPETFNLTSTLSDDYFLNMLCGENMLRKSDWGDKFEGNTDVDEHGEHWHTEDKDQLEVGV
ncbi:unnamed protein product [Lactuca virosa]|uniref:Uncharacterized protein n=1 Tax=Lactuca virosa TaxID=75947 RepID=A0AAU9NI16_9ASTR|nr:unnamed protein product [Lactuca virosa]